MNPFDLKGRVAIVTGGNGGIGLGMAKGMAAAGAAIMVAGRDTAKNAEAVKAIEAIGAKAASFVIDVTKQAEIRALVADTVKRIGRVDILVNNAGTNIRKQPQDLAEAEWHTVIDTNLSSAFLCSQAVYPNLFTYLYKATQSKLDDSKVEQESAQVEDSTRQVLFKRAVAQMADEEP